MKGQRVLAVAGTHGKTTTTSLLTVALLAAGADPTYAIGGVLSATGRNADAGGELFVAEADESDGAFLVYEPYAAVVTNVLADHLDEWGTEAAYQAAFTTFVGRIAPDGFLVCCADDPGAAGAGHGRTRPRADGVHRGGGRRLRRPRRRPGLRGHHLGLHGGRRRTELGRVTLQIPGRHYVLDALAALTVGLRLGHDFDAMRRGLEDFTGTRRRMEPKGEAGGVRVYDSYAHQPAEIAARPGRGPLGGRHRAGARGLPAPPGLAHPDLRRGDGGGARRGRRRWSCSTSTSPARTPTRR